jgi:hypothetical protein
VIRRQRRQRRRHWEGPEEKTNGFGRGTAYSGGGGKSVDVL